MSVAPTSGHHDAPSESNLLVSTDFLPRPIAKIEGNVVQVWRFPESISQCSLGGRDGVSNACSIIAVRAAAVISSYDVTFNAPMRSCRNCTCVLPVGVLCACERQGQYQKRAPAGAPLFLDQPPRLSELHTAPFHSPTSDRWRLTIDANVWPSESNAELMNAVVNCIVDGNEIHEKSMETREPDEHYFTMPEALAACNYAMVEVDFAKIRGCLWQRITICLMRAIERFNLERMNGNIFNNDCEKLCLVLIACCRSVLLVYQPKNDVIGLIDAHPHPFRTGAIVASAHVNHLAEFIDWIGMNIFHEIWFNNSANGKCEISVLKYVSQLERASLLPSVRRKPDTPLSPGSFFQTPLQRQSRKRQNAQESIGRGHTKRQRLQKPTNSAAASYPIPVITID